MHAALRPLRVPALQIAARSTIRCMAGGGAAQGVHYPKPTVFPALGTHKSTLIMLHGLGESVCDRRVCREGGPHGWRAPNSAAAAAAAASLGIASSASSPRPHHLGARRRFTLPAVNAD